MEMKLTQAEKFAQEVTEKRLTDAEEANSKLKKEISDTMSAIKSIQAETSRKEEELSRYVNEHRVQVFELRVLVKNKESILGFDLKKQKRLQTEYVRFRKMIEDPSKCSELEQLNSLDFSKVYDALGIEHSCYGEKTLHHEFKDCLGRLNYLDAKILTIKFASRKMTKEQYGERLQFLVDPNDGMKPSRYENKKKFVDELSFRLKEFENTPYLVEEDTSYRSPLVYNKLFELEPSSKEKPKSLIGKLLVHLKK